MEEQRARKKPRKVPPAAEDDSAEYDLLSSLPEHLIHRILSRLPLKEIVEAHAVCKSWRRIFSSFPVLEFRSRDFVKEGEDDTTGRTRMSRSVDAIMGRFQERHQKIDKFVIECHHFKEAGHEFRSRIVKWTAIALENNAQEISIDLTLWGFRTVAPDPPSLHLSGPTDLLESSSLRKLTLCGFQASEFLSWRGMSACHSLQSLSLSRCHLKEVRISGPPNLKSLSITECTSTRFLEIQAPMLESFHFDGGGERTGCVIDMDHCPDLKTLTLERVAEDDSWFRDFTSRLRRLQDLTIWDCESLTRIRISNCLMEWVDISNCPNLTDISIEAPELRLFHLSTLNGLLPSISMKNPPRSNPVAKVKAIFHVQVEQPPPDWSCKLREFLLRSCKSFRSLSFYVDTDVRS